LQPLSFQQAQNEKILLKKKAITQIAHLFFSNAKIPALKKPKEQFLAYAHSKPNKKCNFEN